MKSSYSNWHCTHTYYAREMCRAILIGHCSARLANHTDLIEWLHWILWNLMNKFILRLLNFLLHLQDMSMMPNFDLCKAHAVLNTSGTDTMSFGKTPFVRGNRNRRQTKECVQKWHKLRSQIMYRAELFPWKKYCIINLLKNVFISSWSAKRLQYLHAQN